MFKISDVWGIVAAMLSLIALYLLVKNPSGVKQILTAGGSASNDLIKSLQGR